ncbi:odorant receptor 131-2-like [Anomaloglossus baeobatrachus]|uniref:odorant receptor 131-2-like n=1 Tax=Anomaloglossus baeobatrachus TaxID=238106 RepID=UPI003F4FB7D7
MIQYELKYKIKEVQEVFRIKLEKKLSHNNSREFWSGMKLLTGFKVRSEHGGGEMDKANEMNEYFNRFSNTCVMPTDRGYGSGANSATLILEDEQTNFRVSENDVRRQFKSLNIDSIKELPPFPMMNLPFFYGNVTLISLTEMLEPIHRTIITFLTLLFFTFFLYIISVLLKVFFSTPDIWETSRYILFVHMLINDTLYLALGNFILLSVIYSVYLPMPVCFMLHTLAACCFRVTPYNLAAMSLERYIAICFPLRHLQFCMAKNARSAILVLWIIGVGPGIAYFTAIICSTKRRFLSFYVVCDSSLLIIYPLQNMIRSIINILSFTTVALIIVFTYIKVMMVARRIGSGRSSALKAGKTVMLHALQLILCMVSFISTITETLFMSHFVYLLTSNFIILTCLPRLLSPVIYGLRDDIFRKYLKKNYSLKF